jgi:integrase
VSRFAISFRAECGQRPRATGANHRAVELVVARARSGTINANGEHVAVEQRKPVRDGTVAADLSFLLTVLNFAVKWRTDDGRYVLDANPARGYPVPKERNPRRPVVTEHRFERVRAAAEQLTMLVGHGKNRREMRSYLPDILDLLNGTGRRVRAILALRYEDLRLSDGPHGSIRWPASTDKLKMEWTVPIAREVRAAINRVLAERPGIGAAFLFPALKDPSKHITVESVSEWLLKAEKLAEVEKQNGSLFHAYRRGWATSRKFLPLADVAAAGGWSDTATLLNIYTQPDADTMYRVVSEPAKLMGRAGHR